MFPLGVCGNLTWIVRHYNGHSRFSQGSAT